MSDTGYFDKVSKRSFHSAKEFIKEFGALRLCSDKAESFYYFSEDHFKQTTETLKRIYKNF